VEKSEVIRSLPLFAKCTAAQISMIADRAEVVTYRRGETIAREGDEAKAFVVVLSGRISASVGTPDGDRVVHLFHRGDTFGEVSLLSGEPHFSTFMIVNDVVALRIPKEGFLEVCRAIPEFALAVSRSASARLRRLHAPAAPSGGQVIAVFSAEMRVGKTHFAENLAASLLVETGRPTALVDVRAGDAEGAVPLGALGDVAFRGAETVVERMRARAAGYHVLDVSIGAADGEAAGTERAVAPLFAHLARRYPYVVLDLPSRLGAVVYECLAQADRILVLSDTAPAHLDRTRNLLGKLPEGARPTVILTFLRKEDRDRLAEWENRLGAPVGAALRDAPDLADWRGEVPYVLERPDRPYSRSVRHVARWIGDRLVGLVLSSGAARGLAHIGVLKVLEREKILVDVVAGSSIGGMIGAAWATGKNARHLDRIARYVNTKRRFFDFLDLAFPPSPGFLRGARVEAFLKRIFRNRTFADVVLPTKVVTTDLETSETVAVDRGEIWPAVRASISIPGIFRPFRHLDRTLVDGAVTDPLPVRVLRAEGVRKIIAVNVIPSPDAVRREVERRRLRRAEPARPEPKPQTFTERLYYWAKRKFFDAGPGDIPNVFDVIVRSNQYMEAEMAEAACRQADVVLRPWAPEMSWLDFDRPGRFIEVGVREAEAHLDELRAVGRRTESAG
jgi:NTE family protein